MIGKLDPEENVMNEMVVYPSGVIKQLSQALEQLNWDIEDDVVVEIAGSQIYEIDGAGTKWAPLKGTRKYNNDAFIVIKNKSRSPVIPSQANPELKQHHA
jgi:hypothetical protein